MAQGDLERALHLDPAGDGRWRAVASPHYESANGIFGGLTAALALHAVRRTAADDAARPASLTIDYLAQIDPDAEIELSVRRVGGGRSISFWRCEVDEAATLLCEVGAPPRFTTESKFARWCGTGAVALSSGEGSGQPLRHRVDFRGNRTVNSVLYIASITQARDNPGDRADLARKTAEGKTSREARRSHKRHLANRVIRRMWKDERARKPDLSASA
jgi:transposase